MKRTSWLLVALVVLGGMVGFIGCGGGGSDGPTANITDVAGTWVGTGTSDATGSAPTTLILTQDGTSVSGTWDGYAVSGSIDGDSLSLTVAPFVEDGVSMTGDVQGVVSGNTISGTMRVTGNTGGVTVTVDGTFTVTRSGARAYAEGGLAAKIIRAVAN